MGKKKNQNEVVNDEVVNDEVVQITSTEIKIISNENLNFKNFKIKKDEELVISDKVFDELCSNLPNLELMRSKGVIQIVK